MTYNEPDGSTSTGGSNLDPADAAKNWISQVQPLKQLGIKLGAPAVTGSPGGFTWLNSFFDACSSQGTNCTADFFPVHWYDNLKDLLLMLDRYMQREILFPVLAHALSNSVTTGTTNLSGSPNTTCTTNPLPTPRFLQETAEFMTAHHGSNDTVISVLSEAVSATLDQTLLC